MAVGWHEFPDCFTVSPALYLYSNCFTVSPALYLWFVFEFPQRSKIDVDSANWFLFQLFLSINLNQIEHNKMLQIYSTIICSILNFTLNLNLISNLKYLFTKLSFWIYLSRANQTNIDCINRYRQLHTLPQELSSFSS